MTGLPELLILLLIILLIFGVGRISKIAGEMGRGIRAFKEGLENGKDDVLSQDSPEDEASS